MNVGEQLFACLQFLSDLCISDETTLTSPSNQVPMKEFCFICFICWARTKLVDDLSASEMFDELYSTPPL
jgi:hypothetical protein